MVNNAPDLRSAEERLKIDAMVHAFATTPHSAGDESVQLFLDEVKFYYKNDLGIPITDSSVYGMIQHFLAVKANQEWTEDIVWESEDQKGADDVRKIKSFRFLIGLRDFVKSTDQQETTELMREVAARYPQYNVTTFMPLWLFTDQYRLVLPNTLQNIAIAMGCMVVIALFLIPQPLCAMWVAVAIASIDIGVRFTLIISKMDYH